MGELELSAGFSGMLGSGVVVGTEVVGVERMTGDSVVEVISGVGGEVVVITAPVAW